MVLMFKLFVNVSKKHTLHNGCLPSRVIVKLWDLQVCHDIWRESVRLELIGKSTQ